MSASDCAMTETPEVLLAALERADEGIVIVDSAHRITHFNAGAERIWKLARADVLGHDAEILTLKCLQADPVAEFRDEISLVRNDGSRIRAAISLSSIASEGITYRIVFARDVTANAERRARIGLLHAVSDQTNRAVLITDTDQDIVYVNAAFTTLFGYTSEEAEGRRARGLLAGRHTDRKAVAKLVKRLMEGGHRGEVEMLAYDKDGEEIWVCARIDAFRDRRARSSTSSRCSRISPRPSSCARCSSSSWARSPTRFRSARSQTGCAAVSSRSRLTWSVRCFTSTPRA